LKSESNNKIAVILISDCCRNHFLAYAWLKMKNRRISREIKTEGRVVEFSSILKRGILKNSKKNTKNIIDFFCIKSKQLKNLKNSSKFPLVLANTYDKLEEEPPGIFLVVSRITFAEKVLKWLNINTDIRKETREFIQLESDRIDRIFFLEKGNQYLDIDTERILKMLESQIA